MGSRAESGKSKSFNCTWDSLRNSAGEKILQLRSHPLGIPTDSNFCALLSDLSLEQRFDVSYLDLGKFWGGSGLTLHFRCWKENNCASFCFQGSAVWAACVSVLWSCPPSQSQSATAALQVRMLLEPAQPTMHCSTSRSWLEESDVIYLSLNHRATMWPGNSGRRKHFSDQIQTTSLTSDLFLNF